MLDDPHHIQSVDRHGFLARLAALPSEELPYGRVLSGPYRFTFGEGDALLAPLMPAAGENPTTEFLVGAAEPESAASDVVRVGRRGLGAVDVAVDDDALAPFRIASYLWVASGRGAAVERALAGMRAVAAAMAPTVPTEENPAKRLAWALWQRVPLLISSAADLPLQMLVQTTFARVGSLFAVPSGPDAAVIGATAFEARHALADDLVGLWLGRPHPAAAAIDELLGSRVAQMESMRNGEGGLPDPDPDRAVDAWVGWYAATWVAAYSALLGERAPDEAPVYRSYQRATVGAAALAEAREVG